MRRCAVIVLGALAVLVGCGGGDDDPGVVDRSRDVPAAVQAFLDRVVTPAELAYTAEYDLLNKNGGGRHVIEVASDPPELEVRIDGEPVDLADEPALARFGIFSGFLAQNPLAAIEASARRADAGDAQFPERDGLDCLAIPVQGAVASTWCLNRDGIFAFVENPSVRALSTCKEPPSSSSRHPIPPDRNRISTLVWAVFYAAF